MGHSIGERVREHRNLRGWPQSQLAKIADIDVRTIQRVEKGYAISAETLVAIAGAFDLEVADLVGGAPLQALLGLAEVFLCKYCAAELIGRTSVPGEYGDVELEEFACGATLGWRNRPCPADPRFPRLEDYELNYWSDDDGTTWYCMAIGKTDAAREVELQTGHGPSKESARRWVTRSYLAAKAGDAAAEAQIPLLTLIGGE